MNCNPKLCSLDEKQRAGGRDDWRHERKDKEGRRVTREGLRIENTMSDRGEQGGRGGGGCGGGVKEEGVDG